MGTFKLIDGTLTYLATGPVVVGHSLTVWVFLELLEHWNSGTLEHCGSARSAPFSDWSPAALLRWWSPWHAWSLSPILQSALHWCSARSPCFSAWPHVSSAVHLCSAWHGFFPAWSLSLVWLSGWSLASLVHLGSAWHLFCSAWSKFTPCIRYLSINVCCCLFLCLGWGLHSVGLGCCSARPVPFTDWSLASAILPSSAQAPAQLSWAELVVFLLYPAPARPPGRPPGIVVK